MGRAASRPRWPMIVLRSPKGWTGPKEVDGLKVEGFWRAHQVPIANPPGNPNHLKLLEQWMRSYEPDTLFDKELNTMKMIGVHWAGTPSSSKAKVSSC